MGIPVAVRQNETRLPYIIVEALSEDDTALMILCVVHTSRNWVLEDWPD